MAECRIAKILTELRTARGVTQNEVAAALGISNKTVSKWENGTSSPDLNMLIGLAEYYHVSTDILLGIVTENSTSAESLKEAFQGLNRGEAALQTFEIFDNMFCAEHECAKRTPAEKADFIPGTTARQFRNQIISSEMFSFLACSDDANIAVLHLRNRSDFAWLKNEAKRKRVAGIFRMLGNPDILRILAFLYTDTCSPCFTAAYIAKNAGLHVERVTELLEVMCHDNVICRRKTVHLKEGEKVLYMFCGDSIFLAVCSLVWAGTLKQLPNHYRYSGDYRMIGGNEE